MNQSAASQPSRKKAVFSLLILLALTCVIVLIFRDHWAEITAALTQLNLWQVLVVLALVLVAAIVAKAVAKPDLKNTTVMENS